VQEEPKNMGAWTFVRAYIEEVMDAIGRGNERVHYIGRKMAASPAAGYLKIHNMEQEALVEQAMTLQSGAKKAAPKRKKAS
jgi:2-oxoglutarate dehydrogenase complex dehydrogenase (E1) component-like enzyme